MSHWFSLWFQDASSLSMSMVDEFHDYSLIILVLITCMLACVILDYMASKVTVSNIVESQSTEFIWTVVPSIILLFIALPSLQVLYLMDEASTPYVSLKITGSQWWWLYEYPNFSNISIESYLSPESKMGDFRLLEVDSRPSLPVGSASRLLITSSDVLHSWSVPSLGVKMDANPGRVNQITVFPSFSSISFGSCTEICGANHSFMPIAIELIPRPQFSKWILSSML